MIIDPDHFLETPDGRLSTSERNRDAWAAAFATSGRRSPWRRLPRR
jgi:hypothetical protein